MTIEVIYDPILEALRTKDAVNGTGGGTVTSVATTGLAGGGTITTAGTVDVPKSSQAQAIDGTDDSTAMTPIRVNDAIDALQAWTESPSELDDNIYREDGFVGFGTPSPTAGIHVVGQVRIEDGHEAEGKVLTTDANGLATWEDSSATAPITDESTDATTNLIFVNDATGNQELHSNTNLKFDSATGTVGTTSLELSDSLTVDGQATIKGGGPGVDKVLTSDATGLASWEDPVAASEVPITNESTDTTTSILFVNDPTGEQELHSNSKLSFDSINGIVGTTSLELSDSLTVDGQATIKGGSPGVDKVLTSNATGLASWETPDVTSVVQVTDESTDTSTSLLFSNNAIGNQELHSNANLNFDSATGTLTSSNLASTSSLIVDGQAQIKGGGPGVDKILTSDATGLASWEDPETTVPITDESAEAATSVLFSNNATGDQDLHSNSNLKFNSTNGTLTTANLVASVGLTVDGQAQIKGGSPGVDKVLTSDATGLASWEDPATTVPITDESADATTNLIFTNDATGNQELHSNANLSFDSATETIGTTNLDLSGQIKISGGVPGVDKILTSDVDGLASWEDPATTAPITDESSDTITNVLFANDPTGNQELHSNTNLKFDSVNEILTSTHLATTDSLTVGGQVTIIGGSPGAGKVLTSDENGLATWEYIVIPEPPEVGIDWVLRSTPSRGSWTSVAYGNGIFVAGNSILISGLPDSLDELIMTSPDGINWTFGSVPAELIITSITYGNGIFVCLGQADSILTSLDGITWTSRTGISNSNWSHITYGNGRFVAVAGFPSSALKNVQTSLDGINWTSRDGATSNEWQSVVYGNNIFVAVSKSGSSNRVMTSSDGFTWTSRVTPANLSWKSVAYGNNIFVAVSFNGASQVMTSPDGITWTLGSFGISSQEWMSITYGNNLFVVVARTGTGNRVITSPDGFVWTSRISAADFEWLSVVYANNIFVAVNFDDLLGNSIMTSGEIV